MLTLFSIIHEKHQNIQANYIFQNREKDMYKLFQEET